MEPWQKILGIIEFIIALIVLLFLIGVIAIITKNRNLEFNGYWKSRTLLASSAFVWVIFLMLGNEYLWSSIDGLFGMSKSQSSAVCSLHVFFTVGVAQPLFFLVCLFSIRSKTNRDKSNNNNNNGSRSNYNPINRGKSFLKSKFSFDDPNDYVYLCSFVCTLPLVIIHVILLILDATDVSEPNDKQVLFTAYDDEQQKCSVPIISTIAFAIFFVIFLIFFIFISRKFSKNIINRSLINRIRLLQFSFIAFLPLEVAIKVVLKATSTIGYTSQALFNAFFFVDIIVILIGILEFALFPILDSLGFYSSSIKLWKFKLMYRSQSDEITNDGENLENSKNEKEVGQNILLTTMSTNVSSTTPNSLIPISDYEKSMKYNNNINNNNSNNNGASSPNNISNSNINRVENYDDDFIQQQHHHQQQQQQTELEKLKIKHKSPILDRVRDTEPVSLPVEPLSTPLSSVSSKSSHLEPSSNQPIHERKKSRRFSLSSKKRTSSSSSSSPLTSTPLSQSPPQQQQPSSQTQNRYLQTTPVDDFKNNLFKYSNHHGGYK